MAGTPRKTGSPGFTLIEMLVTVVVLAVLSTVAIPSFVGVIRNNRAASESNLLLSVLTLARSEAIKRNRPVTVCPSLDGETCDAEASWSEGLMVFVDLDRNRQRDGEDLGLAPVQVLIPLSRSSQILPTAAFVSGITYTPVGRTAGATMGSLRVSPYPDNSTYDRRVVINATGRPQIQYVQ